MLTAGAVGVAPGTSTIRYWPYQDISFKNSGVAGLGIIDPHDWWHTGRPYGLPGTTAIYLPPDGGQPRLAGAGLGTHDISNLGFLYAISPYILGVGFLMYLGYRASK